MSRTLTCASGRLTIPHVNIPFENVIFQLHIYPPDSIRRADRDLWVESVMYAILLVFLPRHDANLKKQLRRAERKGRE